MTDAQNRAWQSWRVRNGALCALPWLYCVVVTFLFGYDAPYWDQWWKVPIIERAFEGTLGIGDLWTLVNEHRVFFPNLITIPLARLSHWNIRLELVLTILFATLAFAVLALIVRRSERVLERRGSLWVLPVAAALAFSFSQRAVWVWGLHVMIAMTAFFLAVMVFVLAQRSVSWWSILGAGLAAVGATYSFGAGVASWPAGLLILLMIPGQPRNRKRAYAIVWTLLACVTMAIYFVGYEATPANQHAIEAVARPGMFLLFVLTYLGAPLFSWHAGLALVAGTLGLVVFSLLARTLHRSGSSGPEALLPYLGLAALAVGAAVLTGLKQSHEGMSVALSSRFLTWPTLFWIALLGLLYLSSLERRPRQPASTRAVLAYTAAAAILCCALASSAYGTYKAEERHDGFVLGRQALLDGRADNELSYLCPNIDVPVQMRETLVRYKLSIFRQD